MAHLKNSNMMGLNKEAYQQLLEHMKKLDSNLSRDIQEMLEDPMRVEARQKVKEDLSAAIVDHWEKYFSGCSFDSTRPMEELIWKKVFYEPVSIVKKHKKPHSWTPTEVSAIGSHILGGIAYYSDMLEKYSECFTKANIKTLSSEVISVLTRTLCYLGDLSRYFTLDLVLVHRAALPQNCLPLDYYKQAIELNEGASLARSNLATVYRQWKHRPLLAALHYCAALTCMNPFDGAKLLLRMMAKESFDGTVVKCGSPLKSPVYVKQFIHTVLATVYCFIDIESDDDEDQVTQVCQRLLLELDSLLRANKCPGEVYVHASALLIATYQLQLSQWRCQTFAVLMASVLLTFVSRYMSSLQRVITRHYGAEKWMQLLKRQQEFIAADKAENGDSPSLGANGVKSTSTSTSGSTSDAPENSEQNVQRKKKRSGLEARRRRPRVKCISPEYSDEDDSDIPSSVSDSELPEFSDDSIPDVVIDTDSEEEESEDEEEVPKTVSKKPAVNEVLPPSELQEMLREADSECGGVMASMSLLAHWLHSETTAAEALPWKKHPGADVMWRALAVLTNITDMADEGSLHGNMRLLTLSEGSVLPEDASLNFALPNLLNKTSNSPQLLCLHDSLAPFMESDGSPELACAKEGAATALRLVRMRKSILGLSSFDDCPLVRASHSEIVYMLHDSEKESQLTSFMEPVSSNRNGVRKHYHGKNSRSPRAWNRESNGRNRYDRQDERRRRNNNKTGNRFFNNRLPISADSSVSRSSSRDVDNKLSSHSGDGNSRDTKIKTSAESHQNLFSDSRDELLNAPLVSFHSNEEQGKFGAVGDGRKYAATSSDDEKTLMEKRLVSQQNLTEQWLKHEVLLAEKEPSTVEKVVVVDYLMLTKHLHTVKHILRTKRWKIVVPRYVLTQLDDTKRNNAGCRDASRWLQNVLTGRNSDPNIKLQGIKEFSKIPGIVYPPKSHSLTRPWYEMMECCNWIAQQILKENPNLSGFEKDSTQLFDSHSGEKAVVYLVTGVNHNGLGKLPFSPYTLASSVGSVVMPIKDFQRTMLNNSPT